MDRGMNPFDGSRRRLKSVAHKSKKDYKRVKGSAVLEDSPELDTFYSPYNNKPGRHISMYTGLEGYLLFLEAIDIKLGICEKWSEEKKEEVRQKLLKEIEGKYGE